MDSWSLGPIIVLEYKNLTLVSVLFANISLDKIREIATNRRTPALKYKLILIPRSSIFLIFVSMVIWKDLALRLIGFQ